MKKRFLAIISMVLALVMSLSIFSGCNLITKDAEKDMSQVVATVEVVKKENIYKKDMIVAYMNYGYLYVNYYGKTQAQALELILDNLVDDRIIIQNAMKELEEDSGFEKNATGVKYEKYDVRRYLTEEQLVDAKYNTYLSINNLLDSYEDEEDEKKSNDLIETVRTAPANAEKAREKLDLEEKKAYIAEGFDINSTTERVKAYTKAIKLFKNNGLLGDFLTKKDADITDTEYYKQVLENNYESQLLNVYEEYISRDLRDISFSELSTEFANKINDQEGMSFTEFTTAVTNASESEPILFSAYGNYGYVYNLLLKASDDLVEKLNDYKKEHPSATEAEYIAERREILNDLKIKDLRSTWILSGYDFDYNTQKFLNDYALAGDNSISFVGKVNWINQGEYTQKVENGISKYYINGKEDKKYVPEYNANAYEINLKDFIDYYINDYIYGGATTDNSGLGNEYYGMYVQSEPVENYQNKVKELIFAFSGDDGALSKDKGYVISPNNSEGFIESFWEAGKKLLAGDGKQGYIIVAGDTAGSSNAYAGYFVLFYSELVNKNNEIFKDVEDAEKLTKYLTATYGENDWEEKTKNLLDNWNDLEKEDTNSYLYNLINSLTSTKVSNGYSNKKTNIVNQYRYENKDAVKLYEKAYKDLLK
ncbi:MAG: hypothetical protein MJ066_00880 [Clostridia bacterium]|nr:hypothetical protein [Clostridia bacterium]